MKTNFKKDKYAIIKKAIDKNLSVFLYNYFHIKKQVAQTLFNTRYISPYTNDYGIWSDPQVPNTYSHYADIARIYKNKDELKKHRDRFSCEISTTMNLGGDPWPIFLKSSKKQIKVNLKPGDMLVYRGCELEHWREKFDGKDCVQVFLHYNNSKTKGALDNIFDNRKHIGLPSWFKNKNV